MSLTPQHGHLNHTGSEGGSVLSAGWREGLPSRHPREVCERAVALERVELSLAVGGDRAGRPGYLHGSVQGGASHRVIDAI
jgi:hypothetical protein